MVQVLLERVLKEEQLNALFKRTAVEQKSLELLARKVFELMNHVVFKTFLISNAAYQENPQQFSVSITSVYNKRRWDRSWYLSGISSRDFVPNG